MGKIVCYFELVVEWNKVVSKEKIIDLFKQLGWKSGFYPDSFIRLKVKHEERLSCTARGENKICLRFGDSNVGCEDFENVVEFIDVLLKDEDVQSLKISGANFDKLSEELKALEIKRGWYGMVEIMLEENGEYELKNNE